MLYLIVGAGQECNTGTEFYAYNVYSYDAGLGKQSGGSGDAETRLGSGLVVKNFGKVFIDGFRGIMNRHG